MKKITVEVYDFNIKNRYGDITYLYKCISDEQLFENGFFEYITSESKFIDSFPYGSVIYKIDTKYQRMVDSKLYLRYYEVVIT